jgi:hypothetical protein
VTAQSKTSAPFWRITRFDGEETPHFDMAILAAEDEEEARERLLNMLEDDDFRSDHSVWNEPENPEKWQVRPFAGGDYFVMGGGCR